MAHFQATTDVAGGADMSGSDPPRRHWVLPLLLFVIVFAVDEACSGGMTADSIRQVAVATSVVHYHTISLDHFRTVLVNPTAAVSPVGHHIYPFFPWGGALFAVPWVVVWDVAHHLGIGRGSVALVRSGHDWELQVVSMATVVAGTSVAIYYLALRLLGLGPLSRRRRWAAGVALAFAFTTPAWSTASRSMWEHGPSMLCLSIGLICLLRARDGLSGWTGLGVALGAAYAMRPTDAIPIVVLGIWVLGWHRRHALAVVAGAAGPLAVLLAVDALAYRQLLTPYYTQGKSFALTPTITEALAANAVSPARGLLVYVPLVVLSGVGVAIVARQKPFDPLWAALVAMPALHWLVISGFKHWWAGDSFGPRLFTDMLPIFVVLALPAIDRMAERQYRHQRGVASFVVVALVWSFMIHAQGATLRSAWCWNNEPSDIDAHPSAKVWSWSDPQFARGIRRLVWGPNRHSELIRDGVDLVGCPTEAVRP